jgi:hypothetical protein
VQWARTKTKKKTQGSTEKKKKNGGNKEGARAREWGHKRGAQTCVWMQACYRVVGVVGKEALFKIV